MISLSHSTSAFFGAKKAFTLLEGLVVIPFIAFQAAMLLPSHPLHLGPANEDHISARVLIREFRFQTATLQSVPGKLPCILIATRPNLFRLYSSINNKQPLNQNENMAHTPPVGCPIVSLVHGNRNPAVSQN
jgi:hypothetical protein